MSGSDFMLACSIVRETDDAALLSYSETKPPVWVPLSQVNKIVRLPDGTARVHMSFWIARKKGLVE